MDGPYVTEVLEARAANTRFFAISRKREINGRFAGVTIVSIAPEYFSEFYSQLPPPGTAALLRADGAVLARYPDYPGAQTACRPNAPFMTAVADTAEDRASSRAPSAIDGRDPDLHLPASWRSCRIFTSRSASSRPTSSRAWMLAMASHLIFGMPATLALVSLGVIALRRTERLQQEVSRRESTEQALRQAQKMEAVGRLTGGIAHDFNNLLTVILGNIDMASRRIGDDDPRIQRLLDIGAPGLRARRHAGAAPARVLAPAAAGGQGGRHQPAGAEHVGTAAPDASARPIAVETVLAGGLWKVAVDPNQLENAILNLAVNARDAMPDGGRLTIETANAYLDEAYVAADSDGVPPGQYVLLAVTDTGAGMTPRGARARVRAVLHHQADRQGHRPRPEHGLRLRQAVRRPHQDLQRARRRHDDQALLPAHRRAARRCRTGPTSDAARPAPSARGSETILLVEDDEEVRKFAAEVLRELGYTRARGGRRRERAARCSTPNPDIDLLFTDVVLPGGMNGRQLADEARRRRPELKVLFTTGYTRNAIIHQGRLDAEVELLTKPFTAEALARKVRQILNAQPSVVPSGTPV